MKIKKSMKGKFMKNNKQIQSVQIVSQKELSNEKQTISPYALKTHGNALILH